LDFRERLLAIVNAWVVFSQVCFWFDLIVDERLGNNAKKI